MFNKKHLVAILSMLTLIISGCGSATTQNQNQIATAVAQTIQAQDSLTKVANITLPTSLPTLEPTSEAAPATPINTSAPASAAPNCTVAADIVGETPPDGAIFKPGDEFLKTWTIRNTGTCTWDKTYKLIFWSGDLMDGLTEYPLPDVFATGEQKDISIYLRAPATEGSFTGYWKIKTPWGANFGVGQYSEPFYVQAVVSNNKKQTYQVTAVDFTLVRDPDSGCATNVYYTLKAAISTNGPLDVKYHWTASGSLFTTPAVVSFTSAQTKIVEYTFSVNHKSTKPTDYWFQFFIEDPQGWDFKKYYVNYTC